MTIEERDAFVKEQVAQGADLTTIRHEVISHGGSTEGLQDLYASLANTPAAAPQGAATPAFSAAPAASGAGMRKLVPVGIGVLAVVLIAGGVYAYATGLIKLPALFGSAPYDENTIARDLVVGLSKIETAAYDATLTMSISERDADVEPLPQEFVEGDPQLEYGVSFWNEVGQLVPTGMQLNLGVSGVLQRADDIPVDARVQFVASVESDDFTVNIDMEGFKKAENFYGRINRMPSFFVDFSPIRGQWVRATEEDLDAIGVDLNTVFGEADEEGEDRKEQLADVMQLFIEKADQHNFITIAEGPITEEVNGIRAYKYRLALNPETARDFYADFFATVQAEHPELYEEGFEDFEEDLDQYASAAYVEHYNRHAPIYVWAGSDGIPVRFAVDARMALEDAYTQEVSDQQVNLTVALDLTDINEPQVLDEPTDSIPLERAIQLVTGDDSFSLQELADERARREDNYVRSYLNNVRMVAEMHYDEKGGSYAGMCDPTGEGRWNASRTFEGAKDVHGDGDCDASASAYAADALLSTGEYYCVDSSGFAGEMEGAKGVLATSCQ